MTIPQERPIQGKEENEKEYRESQQQRALEREVREAKRKAAAYNAAGLDEAFAEQSLQVKQKQAAYDVFCKETGRTRRLDRTQVYGYNRSISGKVTLTNRKRDKNVFDAKNGSYQKSVSSSGPPKVKNYQTRP